MSRHSTCSLSGSKNPNWKGGKPKCIDCGTMLTKYGKKCCRSCWKKQNKGGQNSPSWKHGPCPCQRCGRVNGKRPYGQHCRRCSYDLRIEEFKLLNKFPLKCLNPKCCKSLTRWQRFFCSTSCSTTTRLTGRTLSDEHRRNLSKSLRSSKKFKKSRKLPQCGKAARMWTKKCKGKTHNQIYGKKRAAQLKRRRVNSLRKTVRQRIASGAWNWGPRIGNNEKQILNRLSRKEGIKIERGFHVPETRYFVDGYCKSLNTVYEVYERHHLRKKGKDKRRQQIIQKKLGCQFEVIWDL